MKLVIQRVERAEVVVQSKTVGSIRQGLLILVGITHEDSEDVIERLAKKTVLLRIFADEQGKTNKSLLDVKGEALVVSQFTLYADTKKGNRPSFGQAAAPDVAMGLIDFYIRKLRENGVEKVDSGVFGAHMNVNLCNTGPFTIILES